MSELKVEVVKIDDILEHPNADKMELAMVGGYQVCIQIRAFIKGQLAIYIPVDSILPPLLEVLIFGEGSKVKLHKHRVRAIKLRGAVSQGMLIRVEKAMQYLIKYKGASRVIMDEGTDVAEALDITKYEPPDVKPLMIQVKKAARHSHPLFSKYTNINHLKKYWEAFNQGQDVYVTEKIHGTNFRCGWVPFVPRTFLQKLKNIFGLNPKWEFVYGSHNVQLMDGLGSKAFSDNVYGRIVKEHHLVKIPKGQLWYGEIAGPGIQTGYEYSLTSPDVWFMDIKTVDTNRYMDFDQVIGWVEGLGEKVVPWFHVPYHADAILEMLNREGSTSELDSVTEPIEGFVVRPAEEQDFYGGRLILKLLSDAYLLRKDNTDWH